MFTVHCTYNKMQLRASLIDILSVLWRDFTEKPPEMQTSQVLEILLAYPVKPRRWWFTVAFDDVFNVGRDI